MQVSVIRPVVNISIISKQIIRGISVTSKTIKIEENTAFKSWTDIPGPTSLPIIGILHKFLPEGEFYALDKTQLLHKLYKSYGPIVKLGAFSGRKPMVLLYDAESVEQIHRGENESPIRESMDSLIYYRKVHRPKKVSYTLTSSAGLIDQGEQWKELRSAVNPILLQPKTVKLYAETIDEVVLEMIESLARYFINKAEKEIRRNPKPDNQKGALEKLLDINKDFAYIMASDLLIAGVETASNSVLGILYLLAKNTEKQNKLREELRTNPENKAYLKACIKEGIRMMPVFNGNMRETTKEYNILGYKIPKGTRVIFAHHEMSLMEKYFIRADEYLPERWIAEKDDPLYYRNAHPFAYNPFGFGVRSCVGRRIADLKMETFIKRAIENFEIEWFGPPPKQSQKSVNYIVGPLNFIFKDAKV